MADEPEKPVDLADPEDIKKRNLKIRASDTSLDNTIKLIMSQRNGRDFIRWLLTICRINEDAFAQNALVMAHRTGEQNIGLMVLGRITTRETIDYYVQMLKEGTENG